jgi:hypothetical protein
LALAIEEVDLILILIVKTLEGEVFLVTVHLELDDLAHDLSLGHIVDEMVVHELVVVEETYEYFVIRYKTADNVRV